MQSIRFLLSDTNLVIPSKGDFSRRARLLSRNINVAVEIIRQDPSLTEGILPLARGQLGRKKRTAPTHYIFLYHYQGVQEFIEPIIFSRIGKKEVEGKLTIDHPIVQAYLRPDQFTDRPLPTKSHSKTDTSVSSSPSPTVSLASEDLGTLTSDVNCKYNPYDNLETLPLVEVGSAPNIQRLILGNLYDNGPHQSIRNLYNSSVPYALAGFCRGDPTSGMVEVFWCNDKNIIQRGGVVQSVSEGTEDSTPFFVALQKIHS